MGYWSESGAIKTDRAVFSAPFQQREPGSWLLLPELAQSSSAMLDFGFFKEKRLTSVLPASSVGLSQSFPCRSYSVNVSRMKLVELSGLN